MEDGRVLGQDSNAALALQLVGVHHSFNNLLVRTKRAALAQHSVHQRGLAVVHVRDDSDVANTRTQSHSALAIWLYYHFTMCCGFCGMLQGRYGVAPALLPRFLRRRNPRL